MPDFPVSGLCFQEVGVHDGADCFYVPELVIHETAELRDHLRGCRAG